MDASEEEDEECNLELWHTEWTDTPEQWFQYLINQRASESAIKAIFLLAQFSNDGWACAKAILGDIAEQDDVSAYIHTRCTTFRSAVER